MGRCTLTLACALASAACGRLYFADVAVVPSGPIVVEPTYAQAAGWSAYVRRDRPAEPSFRQGGVPCGATDVDCIHAGVQRMVVLAGVASCTGITAVDTLAALQWHCDDTTGTAIVHSTGLRGGAGLRDLVDTGGWRTDQVRVTFRDGQERTTDANVWWSDPVVALPNNDGGNVLVLDQANTVYVVAAARGSGGYSIEADGIAIVMLPGATLTYTLGAANCNEATGERAGADQRCLITTAGQQFLWFEGTYDAAGVASYPFQLHEQRFMQLRAVRATSGTLSGIVLINATASRLVDVTSANNALYGLVLDTGSSGTVVNGLRVLGNGTRISNGSAGLFLGDTVRNSFTRVVAANNYNYGVLGYLTAGDNTYSHVTLANHESAGIDVQGAGNCTLAQILGVNNSVAVRLSAPDNRLVNLAASHNDLGMCTGTLTSSIAGELRVGNHAIADCRVGGVCESIAECASLPGAPSVTSGFDATSALRYKVTADDGVNASDASGAGSRAAIVDWLAFETPLRGWAADGGTFPDVTNQRPCEAGCRIWDWRHRDGDTSIVMATFAAGAPCPASVEGNAAVTDAIGNTFLAAALELLDDAYGDDDGLCESNEACALSTLFGADQPPVIDATCDFRDGTVSGVIMYGR